MYGGETNNKKKKQQARKWARKRIYSSLLFCVVFRNKLFENKDDFQGILSFGNPGMLLTDELIIRISTPCGLNFCYAQEQVSLPLLLYPYCNKSPRRGNKVQFNIPFDIDCRIVTTLIRSRSQEHLSFDIFAHFCSHK